MAAVKKEGTPAQSSVTSDEEEEESHSEGKSAFVASEHRI